MLPVKYLKSQMRELHASLHPTIFKGFGVNCIIGYCINTITYWKPSNMMVHVNLFYGSVFIKSNSIQCRVIRQVISINIQ